MQNRAIGLVVLVLGLLSYGAEGCEMATVNPPGKWEIVDPTVTTWGNQAYLSTTSQLGGNGMEFLDVDANDHFLKRGEAIPVEAGRVYTASAKVRASDHTLITPEYYVDLYTEAMSLVRSVTVNASALSASATWEVVSVNITMAATEVLAIPRIGIQGSGSGEDTTFDYVRLVRAAVFGAMLRVATGSQTINNATWTQMGFTTGTGTDITVNTGSNVLVVDIAGVYEIHAHMQATGWTGGGDLAIGIEVDGTLVPGSIQRIECPASGNVDSTTTLVQSKNVGQTIGVQVYQATGSSQTLPVANNILTVTKVD